MKTNSNRSAIESVSDIIIETLTEEIISYNDISNKNLESQVRKVIFKQFEEMKKKILDDLKEVKKQNNHQQQPQNNNNSNAKEPQEAKQIEIIQEPIIINKRRVVEFNNEDIKK